MNKKELKSQVEAWIVKRIKAKRKAKKKLSFYPSEIAMDLRVPYMKILPIIAELRDEGKIRPKKHE